MSLVDVLVIEDFGSVFIGELEEVIKKAGISRINEGCFPVVV